MLFEIDQQIMRSLMTIILIKSMIQQQLENMTMQDLQQYERQLIERNERLKSMVVVCQKEHNNLKNRLNQLKDIELLRRQQIIQGSLAVQNNKTTKHPPHPNPQNEKQSGILTQMVTQFTLPAIGKVKQGTRYIGKNIISTGSWIGGSILSFGSSIKNKLFGEGQPKFDSNINPAYLTPKSQIIEVPPIEQSERYQNIIQNKSQSTNVSEETKKDLNLEQNGFGKLPELDKGDSKSIIDKLDAVKLDEI